LIGEMHDREEEALLEFAEGFWSHLAELVGI
jgi:hypothetical protein